MSNSGPARRFPEVIYPGPNELACVWSIVAHRQPHAANVSVFSAEYLSRRFLFIRGKNFVLAIVLSDYVQDVSQPVIVIVADVGAEQPLRYGPRWIVFVKGRNE